MATEKSAGVKEAENILRGKSSDVGSILELSAKLKGEKAFGLARRILALARNMKPDDEKLADKLRQQHALCTYKDPDLPANNRLDRALQILGEGEDLRETKSQETLGLAGAIYKRKWELFGGKLILERSLSYYLRGYQEGPAGDQGYTGINAAFLLDLLAAMETAEAKDTGSSNKGAHSRREEAKLIREDLVATLPSLPGEQGQEWLVNAWWFLVTVAEAFFGLERYDEARSWLEKAMLLEDVPPWEYETTARQLASLARMREKAGSGSVASFESSEAGKVLYDFLGDKAPGAIAAFIGKVGLALSGGGFRASLFHIGVLAKLAELDVLRHVEVLSCVSGGSILGAHYYLELRELLKIKEDKNITREDYIDLVGRLETNFLAGVQKNIRTRVAAEFTTNLKMIFLPHYSRTLRAGELYEKWIYSRVNDGQGDKPRWLSDLYVEPLGEVEDFKPKYDNWRRGAKVPILILNATTLNTGHNWQFTASWMGEPPADSEVDSNYRLRRMYYGEAPIGHRNFRLGSAVAASACVPGLFDPITLKGLYQHNDKTNITVRLVDGGVHDNQGIVGLLDQDCNMLLVSDASGQMDAQDNPSSGILGVPLRSNSILMARVREAQYDDLAARQHSSQLRGLMFVHLKKDLDVDQIDWVDCQDPHEASEEARTGPQRGVLTSHGILKTVQKKLAEIRTDLDSFSETEAYALMTSGYLMTEKEFVELIEGFPTPQGEQPDWRFLQIQEAMQRPEKTGHLMRILDVAGERAFKVWKLSPLLKVTAWILAIAVGIGLSWAFINWASRPVLTVGMIGLLIAAATATVLVGKRIMKIVRMRDTLLKIAIGVGMALGGWLAARIHLHFFDKLFLKYGRIDRVIR